jgi:hypothetical protein
MTAMDLRTTADPTVPGPTEPGTVGSGDTDGAGTAPQILADGAHADGDCFKIQNHCKPPEFFTKLLQ